MIRSGLAEMQPDRPACCREVTKPSAWLGARLSAREYVVTYLGGEVQGGLGLSSGREPEAEGGDSEAGYHPH